MSRMVVPAENQSATLLIVDDDAAARERLRDIFETAQYRVVTATEAASALRVLKGVRCDLVALDLEMPGVDGLALCKLLRAQPLTSKLPIIALSDSDDEKRKVQAFTAGADDYITKPSTPGELLSRVSLHVRTSQREWALIGSNRELQISFRRRSRTPARSGTGAVGPARRRRHLRGDRCGACVQRT